mmetsp:Transcript_44914/g.94250  ORF Transcript_44914/g.94250 Transcript_44914/m.94250 type:complete len:141 (-) Transcript_44914:179-601(-)
MGMDDNGNGGNLMLRAPNPFPPGSTSQQHYLMQKVILLLLWACYNLQFFVYGFILFASVPNVKSRPPTSLYSNRCMEIRPVRRKEYQSTPFRLHYHPRSEMDRWQSNAVDKFGVSFVMHGGIYFLLVDIQSECNTVDIFF